MEIQTREPLTSDDLADLKRTIGYNFSEDLIVRAQIIYIP